MMSLWDDDVEQIVMGIDEATSHIKCYIDNWKEKDAKEMFNSIFDDIKEICSFWTGNTYVGDRKDTLIEKAFQRFFESLMELLLLCKSSGNKYEKLFAEKVLYRGRVYRYLGNGSPSSKKIIKPVFNEIYVSWSKNPCNTYLESKLYGAITWISCEIEEPLYGIDLEVLGCSKSSEREVVFPTIEKFITEIKYKKRNK